MIKDIFVQKAYAANTVIPFNPLGNKFGDLGTLFTWVTNLVILVGLGLVLVFLALGFIKFITSRGDKVETETAQKWVTYAVLGGVGLLAVYAIRYLILSILGANNYALNNIDTGQ